MHNKVVSVQMGATMSREAFFLAIALAVPSSNEEILKVHQDLTEHSAKEKLFLNMEFVGLEIHVCPSLLSEEHFGAFNSAMEKYRSILSVLGLEQWKDKIVLNDELSQFDERMNIPTYAIIRKDREIFARAQDVVMAK